MFDNYVIEIRPKSAGITVQAGIVVRDGGGFRFFAAAHVFSSLDGQLFKTPKAAEHAAFRCVTHGGNLPGAAGSLARTAPKSRAIRALWLRTGAGRSFQVVHYGLGNWLAAQTLWLVLQADTPKPSVGGLDQRSHVARQNMFDNERLRFNFRNACFQRDSIA